MGFLIYKFYQNLEKFKHKKAIIYKSILKQVLKANVVKIYILSCLNTTPSNSSCALCEDFFGVLRDLIVQDDLVYF